MNIFYQVIRFYSTGFEIILIILFFSFEKCLLFLMDKPRVLLISPPVYDFALYDLFLKPYGLLRIGRWLEDGGWDVDFINCLAWDDPRSLEILRKPVRRKNGTGKFLRQSVRNPEIFSSAGRGYSRYGITAESFTLKMKSFGKPDIVFITSTMTYWYEGVFEAVKSVKDVWPDVPVVVGGVYATLLPDHCEKGSGADFTVRGDGIPEIEKIFRKLSLPFPGGSPDEKLLSDPLWKDSAVIRLNRGCPLNCRYCASSLISDFSEGSSEAALNQLEEFISDWGTSNFAFYDDALLFNREKIFIPFIEEIIESGREINFFLPNAVHVNYLDYKTASLMKSGGFREIRLGFESSSDNFHNDNDRKVSNASFETTLESLRLPVLRIMRLLFIFLPDFPDRKLKRYGNLLCI